jgi:hypothetical protein
MSNYHYDDRRGCQNCFQFSRYVDLANLTNYSCDQPCLCRNTSERSTRDQMNYDYYVLGKPMHLQPMTGSPMTGRPMTQVREPYSLKK